MMNYLLKDEAATKRFGQSLYNDAKAANINDMTIYLSGQLGTGKTTLVRGFIEAWGYKGHIKSPTFSLVEPYEAEHGKVYHFDLYRLQSAEELEHMGFRDYFAHPAFRLIEWPENADSILPPADLQITIDYHANGRDICIENSTKKGEQVLATLCV